MLALRTCVYHVDGLSYKESNHEALGSKNTKRNNAQRNQP